MALFGGFFGGDQTPPTQTAERISSPEETRLRQLAMPGIEQFASQQLQQYGGPTYAGFDPSQTAAQNMALGAAGSQQGLADTGAKGINYLGGSAIWDPSINPQIQRTIDAAVRPVTEQLTQSTLPALRGAGGLVGQYASSRAGIAQGLAAQGASREAGDIAARIPTDLYKTNIQAQLSALGMIPQMQDAQLAAARTTGAVGDVRQNMEQQRINDEMAKFNFGQYGDYMKSRELLGLSAGIPAAGTKTTGSLAPPPNKGLQMLGGGLAGAQLGSTLFPGVGTALGAAGGALLPFAFS